MEVRVWTKKGIDDVELWAIFLFKKKIGGKPDLWTTYPGGAGAFPVMLW